MAKPKKGLNKPEESKNNQTAPEETQNEKTNDATSPAESASPPAPAPEMPAPPASDEKPEPKQEAKAKIKLVTIKTDQNINFVGRIKMKKDESRPIPEEEFKKLCKDLPNFKLFVDKGNIKVT